MSRVFCIEGCLKHGRELVSVSTKRRCRIRHDEGEDEASAGQAFHTNLDVAPLDMEVDVAIEANEEHQLPAPLDMDVDVAIEANEEHQLPESIPVCLQDRFIKDLVNLKTKFNISNNGMNAVISLFHTVVGDIVDNAAGTAARDNAMKYTVLNSKDLLFPFKNYKDVQKRLDQLVPISIEKSYVEEQPVYKFSLKDWLQKQMRDPVKEKELEYGHKYYLTRNPLEIGDWWDSECATKIVPHCGEKDIFLHISGDGVQIFRNKLHETGIIDITILNYSPQYRKRYTSTFTWGVVSGPTLPSNWNNVLKPFVLEIQDLLLNGLTTYDGVNRRVVPVLISGDLKFLEKLDEKLSTGTYRCCRKCNCKGTGKAGNNLNSVYYDCFSLQRYTMHGFKIFDMDGNDMSKIGALHLQKLRKMETLYIAAQNDVRAMKEWEGLKKKIGI